MKSRDMSVDMGSAYSLFPQKAQIKFMLVQTHFPHRHGKKVKESVQWEKEL